MTVDFDDFDDDTGSYYRGTDDVMGDSGILLRRAIDIIATAPNMPLSSTPRIDRDEIIELLEGALSRLPDELRQARWMMKEREEFMQRAYREADEIIDAAKVQAERFVQRAEIVRAAEQRARQIMEAAEDDSRRLKLETEDFLDQRLASFEILLDKLARTVATGRRRLSIGDQRADEENLPDIYSDDTYVGDVGVATPDPSSAFFDQDSTANR
ncbi:MAG: DivIVA domain-containing protein [Ilumatobacteraceae bacterium]